MKQGNVEVRKSNIQGKGVFALRDFKKGEEVFRYKRGKFIKKENISSLSEDERNSLDFVDADIYELMEPLGSFVNHSCDPNTVEQLGEKEIVSFAFKPIKAGDEITVDYRVRAFDEWKLDCMCNSKNCSEIVAGSFFSLPEHLQKQYLSFAPKFIKEEYQRRNHT
ncbi:MAG: hypothetical protein A2664_00580 [Candidatus Taylorbacteria bacterium RIFCSPHIGHO2_01_FULL_46_22b]|uniref:SET domain-containing protein n=1 Tax=Candidatus Taylorbacteria bacterium RIFCSPHIGHO2_01_FULL_46_22b TaxID=1802301 RepID=A0A1G2M3F0_9BACT|nr:MAG: hypothetical protein A2664_00580 [Candidatus Taylorbacteria bacterium RIFCSPHIGHO2_01_FULL_46_22b]